MGLLKLLEVQNFKSYKGFHQLGPFRDFQAVIGPNGCGKSNIMDAISFVFGERTSHLRVKHARELIHGAPSGAPVTEKAFVSALCLVNDEEIRFTRQITQSAMTYKLNGKTVKAEEYVAELEALGIDAKGRNSNFLVYQGEVERIAMKNPEELTPLFEKISGSVEVAEEYDFKRKEMTEAESNLHESMEVKKTLYAERKQAKAMKELADHHENMRKEKDDLRLNLEVARIAIVEGDMERLSEERERTEMSVNETKGRREELLGTLADKKKEFQEFSVEIGSLQRSIKKEEDKLDGFKPRHSKEVKRGEYFAKKKKDLTKKLGDSKEESDRNKTMMKDMTKAKAECERQLEELEGEMTTESQEERRQAQLGDDQLQNYRQIKERVSRRTVAVSDELSVLRQEHRAGEVSLQVDEGRVKSLEENVQQLEEKRVFLNGKKQRLLDYLQANSEETKRNNEQLAQLEEEITHLESEDQRLRLAYEQRQQEFMEVQVNHREEDRTRRRVETVEKLKALCPGIYGRMYELCKPRHEKYKLALTKALLRYMDAIVVDTDETAKICLRLLKEQQIDVETFLPLSSLDVKPIDNSLRNIPHAKLLVDCVDFSPPEVEKALQFCLGNSLVCETVQQARTVAMGRGGKKRNVVAYNGTMFFDYGGVSGGTSDLRSKARRFEEQSVEQVRRRRRDAFAEMKEIAKQKTNKLPIRDDTRSKKDVLAKRKDFIQVDLKKLEEEDVHLQQEMKIAQKEIKKVKAIVAKLRQSTSRQDRIQNLQEELSLVEDDEFHAFCGEIGVRNIREFEEGTLKVHEQKVTHLQECKAKITVLDQQLNYMRNSKTTLANTIKSTEKSIEECQENAAKASDTVKKLEKQMEKIRKALEEMVKDREEVKEREAEKDEALKKARKAVKDNLRELGEAERQFQAVLRHLDEKQTDRHRILKRCKLEGLPLPMSHGSFADVPLGDIDPAGTEAETPVDIAVGSFEDDTSSKLARRLYRREEAIEIDFSRLEKLRRGDNRPLERWITEKETDFVTLENSLEKLGSYDAHAASKLQEANDRFEEASRRHDEARRLALKAKEEFAKVQTVRYNRFMEAFDIVKENVDQIYKKIWSEPGAQAVLFADNPEEPYLGAVNYNCIPPGKRFLPMKDLSGGEKSLSALALIFALRSVNHPRLYVLDEVDAALDKNNVHKVARYIKEETRTGSFQCVIISLKLELFHHGDALFGVTAKLGGPRGPDSSILTLDLGPYASTPSPALAAGRV